MTSGRKALSPGFLEERNHYLEEVNRRYLAIFDMLASGSQYHNELSRAGEAREIFAATELQIRRILDCAALGCMEIAQDGSFHFATWAPEGQRDRLQQQVDARIVDGTFAWALNRNQAVLVPLNDGHTLLLQVIETCSRIRGMFVALLPGESTAVDVGTLSALSIVLGTCAYALESVTLYAMLSDQMASLEERVEQRTRELVAAREEAEAANRAKDGFLANVSHELRTPLNGILGMNDLLLASELQEDQRHCANLVKSSAETLLTLVNDLLDLAKIEAGKLELVTSDIDLEYFLADFAALMVPQAQEKGLVFRCSVAPRVPRFLRGDPLRLHQILLNLGSNAIKFTREGEVAVEVALDSESQDGVFLRFAVRDTGIGIAAQKVPLLFKKFTQLDDTSTRQFGGTGLGLAISREIAILMQGRIGVESQEGKGSEFWFTASLAKQPGTRQEAASISPKIGVSKAPAAEPRDRRLGLMNMGASRTARDAGRAWCEECSSLDPASRILLVEDNLTNQQVVLGILGRLGLSADLAANGQAALAALEAGHYDLVLMDVLMPEMGGFEATGRIRHPQSRVRNRQVPIVAMTAYARSSDRAKCLAVGMNDYLAKPISPQTLVDVLNRWLPQAQPPAVAVRLPAAGAGPVAADAELHVWDRASLMDRVMDDDDLVRSVIEGFLMDIPRQISALKNFLEVGDCAATRRQAHTIKGASANVSGTALYQVAREMEEAAGAGSLDRAGTNLPLLQERFDQLKQAFELYHPPSPSET